MDDRTWLTGAIERNRDALLRIAAQLFAIVRLPCGGMVATLPGRLYFRALRILRPAESAVRRLVVLEAIGLDVGAASPRKNGASRSAVTNRETAPTRKQAADPTFQLFDPFKPLPDDPWLTDDGEADPFALPADPRVPSNEPRDATGLCRRIRALVAALDDLPAQARRLARWRVRRLRPRRLSSLRPGWPPGHRKRPLHEVDEILSECRYLVAWAQSPPRSR